MYHDTAAYDSAEFCTGKLTENRQFNLTLKLKFIEKSYDKNIDGHKANNQKESSNLWWQAGTRNSYKENWRQLTEKIKS